MKKLIINELQNRQARISAAHHIVAGNAKKAKPINTRQGIVGASRWRGFVIRANAEQGMLDN